jgi:type I restriction enzyme, S subunit
VTAVQVGDLMLSDESGFACSKTKLVEDGLPHLRPFNIADDGRLELGQIYQVPATEAPPSKRKLLPGDLLFNNTNSLELVGKATIIREPMIAGFSNHLTRIRVDAKRVEPEYFAFWLRRLRSTGFFTAQATQWVSQAAFKTSELRALAIDLPGLDEQRRIVDLLARAEGIVRLRREAQQKAAELIPAIFIDMFGDPATNPEAWRRQPLSAVAEVISGVAKGRKLDRGEAVELPYMRVANVRDGYLDLAEVKTIEIKRSEVEKLLIRPGDLLMTEGGDPDKLGRAALWAGEIDACVHQNHVFKVRSNQACLSPIYLRALAGSAYGKAYFLSVAKKTTGIASINKTQLSAFPVPLPPLPLQQAFERRVQEVESILSQQAEAAGKAQGTFEALLARAFS